MLIYDKRLDKPHKRLHKMLKAREERNLYLQDKQRLIKKIKDFQNFNRISQSLQFQCLFIHVRNCF